LKHTEVAMTVECRLGENALLSEAKHASELATRHLSGEPLGVRIPLEPVGDCFNKKQLGTMHGRSGRKD
jgi:hypothetical protein